MKKPIAIILSGLTGTGKSDVALALASKINGSIISGDVTQHIKEISTVNNKTISKGHIHLQSSRSAFDPYSVVDFIKESGKAVESIVENSKKIPIIEGGSMFYTHALLTGIQVVPEDADEIKKIVDEFFSDVNGIKDMREKILKRYPLIYQKVEHINTSERKLKAAFHRQYYYHLHGIDSAHLTDIGKAIRERYDFRHYVLFDDHTKLAHRLSQRTSSILFNPNSYLEVKQLCEILLKQPKWNTYSSPYRQPFLIIGIKEIINFLNTFPKVKTNQQKKQVAKKLFFDMMVRTRNYAKCQYDWHKQNRNFIPLIRDGRQHEELADIIAEQCVKLSPESYMKMTRAQTIPPFTSTCQELAQLYLSHLDWINVKDKLLSFYHLVERYSSLSPADPISIVAESLFPSIKLETAKC